MESIMSYLKRNLRDVGPSVRDAIADELIVSRSLLRKIAYGDRENCEVNTIQPVLNHFIAVEKGEKTHPQPKQAA